MINLLMLIIIIAIYNNLLIDNKKIVKMVNNLKVKTKTLVKKKISKKRKDQTQKIYLLMMKQNLIYLCQFPNNLKHHSLTKLIHNF